ncbi:MAG: ATP-binding protein [bacterium]|nr:ATP-binding protein [bacterium]MDY2830981.1 ATP-binding protein [Alphaproteobacteria bacterium]
MKRKAFDDLIKWKNSKERKPLLLYGARQVGKTWLVEEFGKQQYSDFIKIDFEKNAAICKLFDSTLDPKDIIHWIETYTHKKITPETLLFFDEVQACPRAITSLKYFCEDASEYHVIAAGSLLGVALHQGISFPVGKVNSLNIYPMTFFEFLDAMNETMLKEELSNITSPVLASFKEKLVELLRTYFYVGGMPEVVKQYAETRNFQDARSVQKRILNDYKEDFSNHIPNDILAKVYMLWDSIPVQLAKENKKFVYKEINNKQARAKDYEAAIAWLKDSGLIYPINRLSKPAMPISAYKEENIFKIYMSDIGLLCAKTNLDAKVILEGDRLFTEFKGALTEQFVLQELIIMDNTDIAYWANATGDAEVDFVFQINTKIVPIEAKAGINLRAKSLMFYRDTFNPDIMIRSSLADYKQTDNLYDIPLYMLENINSFIA